jgi:undecaprenyl-diphosphatase
MIKSENKLSNNRIFINLVSLLFLVLAFIALLVFIKTGIIEGFDNAVYHALRSLKSHTTKEIVKFLDMVGGTKVNLYLGLLLAAVGVVLFSNKEGYSKYITYAAASTVIYFSNSLLKDIFARPHPDLDETDKFSFPSNHAAMALIFYLMLLLMVNKRIKNKAGQTALWIFCIAMPLLIGFSRVYLKNHYASDIIGGYLVVGIVFMIAATVRNIFDFCWKKRISEKISG